MSCIWYSVYDFKKLFFKHDSPVQDKLYVGYFSVKSDKMKRWVVYVHHNLVIKGYVISSHGDN